MVSLSYTLELADQLKTKYRESIQTKGRLALNLRFLASGDLMVSLSYTLELADQLSVIGKVFMGYLIYKDVLKFPFGGHDTPYVHRQIFRYSTYYTPACFDRLLTLAGPVISKRNTHYCESIQTKGRLALNLRFLASGNLIFSLSYTYRIAQSTPKKKRRVDPQQNVEESNPIPIQIPLARPRGLTGVFCLNEDCRARGCSGHNYIVPNLGSNDFQISLPNLESFNDIPGPSGYVSHGKSCGNEFADIPHKATSFQTSLKEPSLLLNDNDIDDDDDDGYMYFQTLPPHITELILLQLPFIDLMKCTLVCKTWYELITDENDSDKGALYMDWISTELSIDTVENCFEGLIKYFSQYYKKRNNTNYALSFNEKSKIGCCRKVISERFPEFLKNESKAWCIFATTILLSETVEDCTFWIENEPFTKEIEDFQPLKISKKLLGQQSIHSCGLDSKILLTNEQQRILNHKLQPGDIVKINGLAGTGKTTTLIHLAQLYPQMKFLHITFNEDICEEAEKLFPPNVSCKTVYSIADDECGEILNSQLISKLEPQDLVSGLELESESDLPLLIYAKFVLVTIENFVSSADTRIL
ncbi:f-box DNA helicase 1 [Caerostris extrusa]|uniref:F-box DNA helicase 1 n=1 Tax=Caerostris extrusa TaxID=172846 RepID=A0AAV4WWQ0_CAEEX|nr:f-box DNA helicase 1 [Caerostris extrusa]